jgi:hypothetical protein
LNGTYIARIEIALRKVQYSISHIGVKYAIGYYWKKAAGAVVRARTISKIKNACLGLTGEHAVRNRWAAIVIMDSPSVFPKATCNDGGRGHRTT